MLFRSVGCLSWWEAAACYQMLGVFEYWILLELCAVKLVIIWMSFHFFADCNQLMDGEEPGWLSDLFGMRVLYCHDFTKGCSTGEMMTKS